MKILQSKLNKKQQIKIYMIKTDFRKIFSKIILIAEEVLNNLLQ